ncbi:AKAP7 2'5' RNA ligase-like domain-containing protein [Apodospora peruviana]|uniref:AKAP7 2'5' RNA ligase-like domain-containing protein n=1 Tax=Apodospora peruviana TaxID=516989 RepID=A0AAE0HYL8_9PEZI|nr:AKAP7 2'5' RNA ligase-like domain-containing protein [Apodospora peruviana]
MGPKAAAAAAGAATATTTATAPKAAAAAPTHFLCIPLVTRSSRPQLVQSLASFRADVTNPAWGSLVIPEGAIRPVGTLHLTLGVFSFPTTTKPSSAKEGASSSSSVPTEGNQLLLEKAREVLHSLQPREILASVMPGSASAAPVKGKDNGERESSGAGRLKITLRGLQAMQSTAPAKASVLYAPPVDDPSGVLYRVCEKLREAFHESGLMARENRPLLLHATIVNTVYVKGGGRKGKGGRREKLTIDARGVLERYEDQVWMEDVQVEKVAICKMGAKKVVLEDGAEDEVYEVVDEIECREGVLMPRKPAKTTTTPPTQAEKRRQPPIGGGTGSPSRRGAMRTPISNNSTSPNARNGGSSGGLVIAAPPRAALSGTSSPAPVDEYRNTTKDAPPASNSTSSGSSNSSGSTPPATATATATATAPNTQTTTATAHLLREKDDRIAYLERELGIMETEFHRELDKLSAAESETSSFWQAKYSALNQQFLRADTELRLLRAEVDVRDAERDEMRARYEGMARLVSDRDEECRNLRAHIRGLKEWVSTSTRASAYGQAQTSDEVFGDGMARLGNGLQNWVLVHFRRAKIDLSKVDNEGILEELGHLVPMYEDLAATAKVHLLQSIVSQLLVESVFDTYFVGLSSEETQHLTQVEAFLSSFATSPEPINQWRSMTLTILKKEAHQRMQTEASNITETIVRKVNTILDAIVTDNKATEARDQALRALVSSAIELSRLLVVQKAIFKVHMPKILPHQKIMFDRSMMEDMGGEDEDGLDEREICCVTFPGIIKRGDESGGQLQFRNVISKARVLCSPD